MLACLYGALLLIGATLGGEDPLGRSRRRALGGRGAAGCSLPRREESSTFRADRDRRRARCGAREARTAGQPVMLDFTAEWCVSCKEMEEYTFPEPGVIGALKPFMLLRADVTDNNDDDQALLQRFRSFGPPTIAFFDRSGFERENYKLVGFVPADKFREHVDESRRTLRSRPHG